MDWEPNIPDVAPDVGLIQVTEILSALLLPVRHRSIVWFTFAPFQYLMRIIWQFIIMAIK